MSTKIYNAYEWHGGSLEKLQGRLFKMQEKLLDMAVSQALRNVEKVEHFGTWQYQDAFKKVIRSSQWEIIDPELGVVDNPHSSAVIYLHKGRVFVQFFGLPRDFKLNTRGLKDYHYQNQTDKPDEVTDKEWNERRKMWDILLKKHVPSQAGLVFDFVGETHGIEISHRIFKKLHGHDVYSPGGNVPTPPCEACTKRRAYIAEQDAKKKAEASK